MYVHCIYNLLLPWDAKHNSISHLPLASSLAANPCADFRDRFFWRASSPSPSDFTRERLLTFPVVLLFVLQKTTKSIQRHAHAFFQQLWPQTGSAPSPPRWTQARAKLRSPALIELNQQVLLPGFYAPEAAPHRGTGAVIVCWVWMVRGTLRRIRNLRGVRRARP